MTEKKLSTGANAALATLILVRHEQERMRIAVSDDFIESSSKWGEGDLFLLYDELIGERYSQNPFNSNLKMFCEDLMRMDNLFPGGMHEQFTEYLTVRWTSELLRTGDDPPKCHPLDCLIITMWVYEQSSEKNKGKVRRLARLCGEKLDPLWVDSFCRSHIDLKVHWQVNFREELANGINKSLGHWRIWNLISGLVIDQSNPHHFSREQILKGWISLLNDEMVSTPDGKWLVREYIKLLRILIGNQKTIDFLASIDFPPGLYPE